MPTFQQQVSVDAFRPPEHYQYALRHCREQVSRQLFDILWQQQLPAVVRITEHEERTGGEWLQDCPIDVYTISVEITPVQHQHVVIPHHLSMDYRVPPKMSFVQKLKWLFSGE